MMGIWGVVEEQWRLGDMVSGVKEKFKNSYHSIFLINFL